MIDQDWLNSINAQLINHAPPEVKPMRDILVRKDEKACLIESVLALPDDAQLLEYGSGGSTELFASLLKPGQHLTSIEHNQTWKDTVECELVELGLQEKVTLIFVPLPQAKYAIPDEEKILPNSEPYQNPPVDWSKISWVFVDGIMRGPILSEIRCKLTPGTPVFLHDFCGRESWYEKHLAGYDRLEPIETLLPLIANGRWLL